MPAPSTARPRRLPDTSGWTSTDHAIVALIGLRHLPAHLTPAQLLRAEGEQHVPPALRPKVAALRALVDSRLGLVAPLSDQLGCSTDVASYFMATIGHHAIESFWVMLCDSRNRVRSTHRVATGSTGSCPVPVDRVIRLALLEAASAIIVVHNHPSGDPTPSPEDIALMARLSEAADVVGVRLLDHVIVGAARSFSFLDAGLMARAGGHRG